MVSVLPVPEESEGALLPLIESVFIVTCAIDVVLIDHPLEILERGNRLRAVKDTSGKHRLLIEVIATEGSQERHILEVERSRLVLADIKRIRNATLLKLLKRILELLLRPGILPALRNPYTSVLKHGLVSPESHAGIELRH